MTCNQSPAEQTFLPVGTTAKSINVYKCIAVCNDAGCSARIMMSSILLKVHHIQFFGLFLPSHITVVSNGSLTSLTAFCGNHDNTVRCACTINGGGGSIFQYIHGYNITRVDVSQCVVGLKRVACIYPGSIYHNTINDEDRLVGRIQ